MERRVVKFWIVRSCGTVIAITGSETVSLGFEVKVYWRERLLSPVTFLMKICMVEITSGDAERERGVEESILSVGYRF